jgi:hypothetical protein
MHGTSLFLTPRMVIGMLNWMNRARMLLRLVHLGGAIGGKNADWVIASTGGVSTPSE